MGYILDSEGISGCGVDSRQRPQAEISKGHRVPFPSREIKKSKIEGCKKGKRLYCLLIRLYLNQTQWACDILYKQLQPLSNDTWSFSINGQEGRMGL